MMLKALAEAGRVNLSEKDRQIAGVTAERDQLKAVIDGPEWAKVEEVGGEYGPHAALAEARAILVDAYKLREHAIQKAAAADEAREAAEKQRAESAKRKEEANRVQEEAFYKQRMYTDVANDLKGHAKDIDMAWTALVIWLVVCSVLAGIAAWPVVEGWLGL